MNKIFLLSYLLLFISIMGLPADIFSQNVGIGISNPTRAKLELNGAAGATTAIFGGETTGISFQSNFPAIGFNQYHISGHKYISNGYAAQQYLNPNNGDMVLDMFGFGNANASLTSINRAFTIANNGNIGIGTAPFSATLFALRGTNFDGVAAFGGTTYNSHFNYGLDEHTYIRGGKAGSYVFLNDIVGNNVVFGAGNTMVGINTGNPTYTLEISQTNNRGLILVDPAFGFNNWEYRVGYYASAPNSDLKLFYNGVLKGVFETDGQYGGIISDRRVKTNIKPMNAVIDKLNQLQPSVYEMKDHNDNHEKTFGFIAQDVKLLFPELVSVNQLAIDTINRIPDLHALNYTGFNVIAIKALQEQYLQIQALQIENDGLMKRLEALEVKIR